MTIKHCSDIDALEFVADTLEIDFTEQNVLQSNKSEGHFFIHDSMAYRSNLRYDINNLLGRNTAEYIFCNSNGLYSFSLLEWRSNDQYVNFFRTLYQDNETKERLWEYILPPPEYMIFNRHLIDRFKNKIVHIHDDIAEVCLSNSEMSTGTWAGDLSVYQNLDWPFLKGRNVSYLFNNKNKSSIEIGHKLLQMFKEINTPMKLYPRIWPRIGTINGDKTIPAFKTPSWPNAITIEEFYNHAKWRHDIDLIPNEKYINKIPTTIRDLDKIDTNASSMVDNLFDEGAYVLMTERQKVGKSLLSMDTSYMLASGESIADRLVPKKPYKVLYVDSEISLDKFKLRTMLLKVNYNKKSLIDENFNFLPLKGINKNLDISEIVSQKFIESYINHSKFIVFDNLDKLAFGAASSPSKWKKVSNWFQSLTGKGITVFLVHHENDTGNPRGIGKITDDVDLSISLIRPATCPRERTIIEFHIVDSRYFFGKQVDPFIIEYCTEYNETKRLIRPHNSSLHDNDNPIASCEKIKYPSEYTDLEKEILNQSLHNEKLYVKPGMFIVKDGRSGRSKGSVSKAINRLCHIDMLIKTGRNRGTKYVLKENWNNYCRKYDILSLDDEAVTETPVNRVLPSTDFSSIKDE